MNIHEHQAKQILKKYGAVVPEGIFSFSVTLPCVRFLFKASIFLFNLSAILSAVDLAVLAIEIAEHFKTHNNQQFLENPTTIYAMKIMLVFGNYWVFLTKI